MKTRLALLVIAFITVSNLSAAQSSTQVEVQKIKTEPVPLQTAEYADVWLKVVNRGDTEARNTVVNYRESFPFSPRESTKQRWEIGDITPGEEYHIHLQVKVDENAVQGENRLLFNISSSGNNVFEEKVPVEVRTDDPILEVYNVSFPEKVAPGSQETMAVTLKNNADSQLRNVQASLELEEIPFATRRTSSQQVRTMEPGEEKVLEYTVQTDRNADNGLYKIPVSLEYENEAGTEFTRRTIKGAVVGGEPDLEVAVNDQEINSAGETGTVTLRTINRGYGEADFVKLSIPESEGYEIVSQSSVYLGNMGPDDYQTAEFTIHAASEEVDLPVELSYRTSEGSFEKSENVPLKLYSGDQLRQYGLTGGGNTLIFAVIAGVLIVAGIYYWRRRRKR